MTVATRPGVTFVVLNLELLSASATHMAAAADCMNMVVQPMCRSPESVRVVAPDAIKSELSRSAGISMTAARKHASAQGATECQPGELFWYSASTSWPNTKLPAWPVLRSHLASPSRKLLLRIFTPRLALALPLKRTWLLSQDKGEFV